MLPNNHFNGNNTHPDHWLGFVDAIYAICITIISLELPGYIANLENIHSLLGLRGTFVIATMDGLAYACLFFNKRIAHRFLMGYWRFQTGGFIPNGGVSFPLGLRRTTLGCMFVSLNSVLIFQYFSLLFKFIF